MNPSFPSRRLAPRTLLAMLLLALATLFAAMPAGAQPPSCEDSIGCMHGSSEPDLRNWKSPPPQFTQGARPDE
ncbi:hypothetical protein, partial [Bordetella pertussis]